MIKKRLSRFFILQNNTWAISLVVERRSPKPLVGVRFLHRPQKKYLKSIFCDSKQRVLLVWRNRKIGDVLFTKPPITRRWRDSFTQELLKKLWNLNH